jgi:hypothetical protein
VEGLAENRLALRRSRLPRAFTEPKDGVLTVTIGKKPEVKAKKIELKPEKPAPEKAHA